MTSLTASALQCRMCPALCESRSKIVDGTGSADPVAVFVLDKPSREDDQYGSPALDRSGTLLRGMVAQAGIPSGATFYTNAVRCRTPKDRIPTSDEISACSGWLAEEIGVLEPVVVVLLGKAAEIAYERIKDELTFDHRTFRLVEPEKAWKDKRKRDAYQESLNMVGRYLKGEDIGALPIIEPEPWSEGIPDIASPWLAVDTETDSLEDRDGESIVSYQLSDGTRAAIYTMQGLDGLRHAQRVRPDSSRGPHDVGSPIGLPDGARQSNTRLGRDAPVPQEAVLRSRSSPGGDQEHEPEDVGSEYGAAREQRAAGPLHTALWSPRDEMRLLMSTRVAPMWYANVKYDSKQLGVNLEDADSWEDVQLVAYVLREVPVGLKKLGPRITGLEMESIKPLLTRRVPEDKWIKLTRRGLPKGAANVDIHHTEGDPYYLKRSWKTEPRVFSEALAEEPDKAKSYALLDAVVTSRLAQVLWPRLEAEPRLMAYYKEIEKPIVPVVAMMEDVGVRVDPAMLQQLDLQLTKLIDEYEEIAQLALEVDETFKINSPEQLAARLSKLGIRLSKETASGNKSVDKNSLLKALDAMNLDDIDEEEIAQDQAKTALMSVLRYRQFKKLKATYVDYLASHYDADQRIHGSYNQTVTDTNRFSSSDPNLQNIPNRSAIGKSIRKAFVARPGYKLIRTDASNLEVRVWAHWTDDDVLRQVFVAGGDAHGANALRVFGSDKEKFRKPMKNGFFARMYGASDEKFLTTLGVPAAQGQPFLKKLAVDMPALIWWPKFIESELQTKGYVETLFGWRNYYPHYWSPIPSESHAAIREAGNMPIQGTASGIIKKFMIAQYELCKQFDSVMVLQVHDETVCEVPEAAVPEFARLTHDIGSEIGRQCLSVPLEFEVEVGDSWGQMSKMSFGA